MEIEVGEYIRTNQGIIGKIKRIELDKTDKSLKWYVFDKKRPDMNIIDEIYINKPYIVNHSKKLIDLIEVTDIIKYRINNISTTLETKGYIEGIVDISDKEMLQRIKNDKNYEILEILTHEQFEQNSYKVGGEDE